MCVQLLETSSRKTAGNFGIENEQQRLEVRSLEGLKTRDVSTCPTHIIGKVNSAQEACPNALWFTMWILQKFEIFKSHEKKWNKEHQALFSSIDIACGLQDFNMWTAKHFMQASCTELTLNLVFSKYLWNSMTWKKIDHPWPQHFQKKSMTTVLSYDNFFFFFNSW